MYNQDNERVPFVSCIRESICRQMLQLARKVRTKLGPLSCTKKRESITKLVSSSNYPFLGITVDQGYTIINHKDDVKTVWSGVSQEKELRLGQYQFVDNLKYFINMRFDDVCEDQYIPTKIDVLRTRYPTSNTTEHRVQVKKGLFGRTKFVFTDVGGQVRHRDQWPELLEKKKYILFFASLAEYNEKLEEDQTINRLQESIDLFRSIVEHMQAKRNVDTKKFQEKSFMLMLNKEDLFRTKFIDEKISLSKYFPDYKGPENDINKAKDFIKNLFLDGIDNAKIYTRFTIAIDESNVKSVFNDIMHNAFFSE